MESVNIYYSAANSIAREVHTAVMIPFAAYKIVHLTFIFVLFLSLGAYAVSHDEGRHRIRRLAAVGHGVATLFIVVSGFGMLAQKGIISFASWQPWVWAKFAVWVAFALSLPLLKRVPALRGVLWVAFPLLGALAAYMALVKPPL